jgi:hypothetical protein
MKSQAVDTVVILGIFICNPHGFILKSIVRLKRPLNLCGKHEFIVFYYVYLIKLQIVLKI